MKKFKNSDWIPLLILMILGGCVELYEFRIEDENPALVIEGQISDLSYREYMDLPADGRYFTVRLSTTGDVTNNRNQPVRNASVILTDSRGNAWNYESSEVNPGLYLLFDKDFKAVRGIGYQLKVILQDGDSYESGWETLPDGMPETMGDIVFEEVVRQQYVYRNRERVLEDVRGVAVKVGLPKLPENETVYYQWDFDATWIFRAMLVSVSSPLYRCWVTDPQYLSDYVVHHDLIGGYDEELFFLKVDGNDKIFDRISILISQYALSEHYFNYLSEIRQQDDRKGLFDPPPFNLLTNLKANDPAKKVYGYFGVVGEKGKRWAFSRTDLKHPVPNTWQEFCDNPNILPGAKQQCYSCLDYGNGIPTTEKPWWWE